MKLRNTGFGLAVLLLLAACSQNPQRLALTAEPAYAVITAAYTETVRLAWEDEKRNWHHGRIGNTLVNTFGGDNVGLCFHWQEIVYVGIQPALRQTGWQATGIEVNRGTFFEHHAVLVYDPQRVQPQALLQHPDSSVAFVLDPWADGIPRTFTVREWLDKPLVDKVAPAIEELRLFKLTGFQP